MFYPNLRTEFSFRTAYGRIDEVLDVGTAEGQTHVGVADRSSTFGHIALQKYCNKKDVTPIFGVELGVVRTLREKKPTPAWMSFIARNDKGLKEIYDLVGVATSQFRYIPRLDYSQLHDVSSNVAVLLGQTPSLDDIEPRKNFIFNLTPSSNRGMLHWAEAASLRIIATTDNYFIRPTDSQVYEVLCGRNASMQTWAQWIINDDEFMIQWPNGELYIDEAVTFCEECNASLTPGKMLIPKKSKSLSKMCFEGALQKDIDLEDPVYAARLEKELAMIEEKGFEDYFYIIADIVQWSKQRMLVGPARGSSCGSLVCFLLDITTVDPIVYGLIFERFIDINRADLPDIDIDFNHEKREQVFTYMAEKYGESHVARLGTVAMYGAKSAVNETAAALKIPQWEIDKLRNGLIEYPIGHPRSHNVVEDTLADTEAGEEALEKHPEIELAVRIEGHARHYSQHAAGMLITEQPTTTHVAVDRRTGSTMCDKRGAEDLGLLKIDALGLIQLSVIEDCLMMMNKSRGWLFEMPLDDPAAFRILNECKFAGIFQFQGQALQNLTKQIKVSSFNDIASLTALARPGPLMSGAAADWVDRKNGKQRVPVVSEQMTSILSETYGVLAYQEQLMRIARDIGGLDWPAVSSLRKAVSKSLGTDAMNKFREQFVPGAIKSGLEPDVAERLWDGMCQHGAYSFNKSHSVAYSVISYWCCLLKHLDPVKFACASIRREASDEAVINMLREVREEGILHIPFDKDLSGLQWEVHDGKLLGPLTGVKGVGPKIAEAIAEWRASDDEMPER
jgi:DNA-directed DNA polymerase III PolC